MRYAHLGLFFLAFIGVECAAQPWRVPKSDFGGAIPLNLYKWVSPFDIPVEASRAGEEGYVTVSFTIGTDGRVTDCHVIRSSGYARLDAIPCNVLPARARFTPAKDVNGQPIATHGTHSIPFWNEP
jgi:TonB family protein